MPAFRSRWYRFACWFVQNLLRCSGGYRIVGSQNFPMEGAVIVAPNHLSNVDPPAVGAACPRQVEAMSKMEWIKAPIVGPLLRSLGVFGINRGEVDMTAIRHCLSILEKGNVLLMFPEGTRGNGKILGPLFRGTTMIAKSSKAKVVPAAIVGSEKMLPKGAKFPKRASITIAFGVPFTYQQAVGEKVGKDAQLAFEEELSKRIVAICAENGLPLQLPNKN